MEDRKAPAVSLTRRDALKTLAAVTGAVALSSLPNNWQKPAVVVGSLPAMAQEMSGVTIDSGSLSLNADEVIGAKGQDDAGFVLMYDVRIQFDYINAVGGVALMDVTFVWDNPAGQDSPNPVAPTTHVVVNNPNGTPGHIDHTIPNVSPDGLSSSANVSVFIKDGSGVTSNTVTGTLNLPEP